MKCPVTGRGGSHPISAAACVNLHLLQILVQSPGHCERGWRILTWLLTK